MLAHLITMAALHRQNRYDRLTDQVEKLTGSPSMSIADFVRMHAAAFEPAGARHDGTLPEDFAPGQKFASGQLKVDRERIKSFAAEFDPQPFHLDEEAARGSVFKGLAASGWHTAAMTMRLLVESELKPGVASSASDSTNFAGRAPYDRTTLCIWRSKCSRYGPPGLGPIKASSR